jgi:predicted enzyme related to lactoylglutathione lyase
MKRVTGIGGIFLKCDNSKEVALWYNKYLGINIPHETSGIFEWRDAANPQQRSHSVCANFKKETKYFESGQKEFMINYRVENLKELPDQLRSEGVEVVGEIEEYEYGKFGWIMDAEGNKIDLWEADDKIFREMNKPGP